MSSVVIAAGCSEGSPPSVAAQPASEEPIFAIVEPEKHVFRAIWVLCEGSASTLSDPGRIEALIADAVSLGVTDLFVQVYRSGRAWYDASLADASPYRDILGQSGVDPLRRVLDRAHAAGIRVHAWVNVYSLNANRAAPILVDLGEASVLVDRRGRSLLDYPGGEVPAPDRSWYRMGTPGLYLDPGAPGVRDRLVATFVELVDRYADLDGLHLDYVRHPGVLPFAPGSRFGVGLEFGYGDSTREQFQAETGRRGPYSDPANPSTSSLVSTARWDAWRRDQVTELVRDLRLEVLAKHHDLLISAAVIAYADRAYLSLLQDWRGWVEDGLLDFAVPMIYTRDDRLFRYQVESFANGPRSDRIWMGTGTWLFASEPERAIRQLRIIREAGGTGEAIFSYDALVESEALRSALVGAAAGPKP